MIQTTSSTCSYVVSTGSVFIASYSGFSIMFNCNSGGANNILQVDAYNAAYYPSTGGVINDGLWHSVLVTYDGTTLSIYVDGRLDGSATNLNGGSTATIASTLNTVGNEMNRIGAWVFGDTDRWSGKLKNVMFFDYVITDPTNIPLSPSLVPTISPTPGSVLYSSGNIVFSFDDIIPNNINEHYLYHPIKNLKKQEELRLK
jgi:hypothetical protein